jgi:transposase InsO family protein
VHTELLGRHRWTSRRQLAQATFEWIAVFYNRRRRHSIIGMHAPVTSAKAAQSAPAA